VQFHAHLEISADMYANPFNAGAVVNRLDFVILGATEVDVDFNVNVNTESTGYLLHNTGGHPVTSSPAR
jgi:citrate lyase subunit alpha/citrate CoA-transferase